MIWFQLTKGASITEAADTGFPPGFTKFPRRMNWQKRVPHASFEHTAAVKFGSPQAFLALQLTILPSWLVTVSTFSFSTFRFVRTKPLKKLFYFPTFTKICDTIDMNYLFSEWKLSVSFIKKNFAPKSVSCPKFFKSKSSPMSALP